MSSRTRTLGRRIIVLAAVAFTSGPVGFASAAPPLPPTPPRPSPPRPSPPQPPPPVQITGVDAALRGLQSASRFYLEVLVSFEIRRSPRAAERLILDATCVPPDNSTAEPRSSKRRLWIPPIDRGESGRIVVSPFSSKLLPWKPKYCDLTVTARMRNTRKAEELARHCYSGGTTRTGSCDEEVPKPKVAPLPSKRKKKR